MENILVVDDEEAIREVVSTMLESKGYRCTAVQNGRVAQDQVKKATPDLVLSDMIMPEMDGIRLLEWMRQYDPEVPVIMVTAIRHFHSPGSHSPRSLRLHPQALREGPAFFGRWARLATPPADHR